MASWPETTRLIGTNITRMDGLAKASGRAKYPSDVRPEGMLFGVMLSSPHASASVKAVDVEAARKMPGVKAVLVLAAPGEAKILYQGQEIAAVAAETEEKAVDAARAIKVEYEILPHVVTERQSMAADAPKAFAAGNFRAGRAQSRGKPEEAMQAAEVTIEGTYSLPVITHVCLETHGLTAEWKGPDSIVAYASTQSVMGVAKDLTDNLQLKSSNVTVLTEVMGGGFGSKFGADVWGIAAAKLAKETGRPVRLFLDRAQEHLIAGNRPSAAAHVKLGATKDGKIVALSAETHGTGGRAPATFPLPYVYRVENSTRSHTDVFVNCGGARAMRAPGHPQGCAVMESAMDDLADKLGINPLELRLKNLGETDMVAGGVNRTEIYREQVARGAKLIGWERWKPRGQNGKGPVKRGLGMALHQWGGGGQQDKQVSCVVNSDGSVELKSATQDIGTGARTILAIIAAEVFGLEVGQIKSNIGNSTFPPGQSSGGSTTTPSMAPPCYDAAIKARDELFAKIAPSLNAAVEDLSLKGGKVLVKGEEKMTWAQACRRLGLTPISVTGKFSPGLSSTGVGGCQFAEVTVDVETGVVKLKKIVAVQDTGLILDMLTWKSQVYGGVIGGLNYGMFEERIMDEQTGTMLNPDMELYKLAGATDVPEIIVEAYDTPEMRKRGVIGVGEPPTISTAAAIGNAVANAIGVRVPQWPMSPMNVLNALAKEGKA
jgi:xanthine dehydrogenase YagR molybdenum-binding subunit